VAMAATAAGASLELVPLVDVIVEVGEWRGRQGE